MFKTTLTILFLFLTIMLFGQEPAYKKYTTETGMPDYYYFYLAYANDTLFLSTDEVNLYTFNGIDFKEIKHPPSKYMFREIKYLKKGYFMRNTVNHYWYRPVGGDWMTIKTPNSNIVFHDTLLGFNSDTILYFNENFAKWDFLMKIKNPDISVKTHYPYIYLDKNNKKTLIYRKRVKTKLEYNKGESYYDIVADTFIYIPVNSFQCQGSFNGKNIFLNQITGDIKWDFFKDTIYPLSEMHKSVSPSLNYRLVGKQRFDDHNKIITSNIFEQENKLHFVSFDTLTGINYRGTFNIPRANYKRISEDLFFVGSFEGMFKVNPNNTYYSLHNSGINKNIRSIVKHKGTILMAGYGSGFCKLKNNDFVLMSAPFQKGKYKNILNGGFALNENEAYFFNEGYNTLNILKNNKIKAYEIYSNGQRSWAKGYFIDTLNDGRLAFSMQYDNFGVLDSIVKNRVYITALADNYGMKHGNSWVFDQDDNSRIWLGRFTAGLAVFDTKADTVIQYIYDLDEKKSFGVVSMYIDRYDQLWLGTNKGLYILKDVSKFDIYNSNIFDQAVHIELPNGDNSLVAAIKEVGKFIVVGNKTGISFLKKGYFDPQVKSPIHQLIYGEDINGSGTEQNCMLYDKERYLWVSTIDGVLKIDMWAIHIDTTGIDIKFDDVKNADNYLEISDDKIKINAVKRNLNIRFSSKDNPSFLNNIYYDFMLTNSKNDTLINQCRSKNNSLRIDYFNPDNYLLKVKAYKNGILKDTAVLSIFVPYTFGENPWIWLLLSVIFLSLLSGFFYYRKEKIKQIAKKELSLAKTENEKTQLKVQAIISTFNPHFINNSLHWVQSKYYKDPEMTKMIGRLSDNINYIFKITKSGSAVHKMKEELEIIQNYITIQQLRFGNTFKYIPPSLESLNKFGDLEIIVLQIQIHVENAIEHGIRNRVNSSFVKVDVFAADQYIVITITDDGNGRTAAKNIKSRGNQTGVKMLNELHIIYNDDDINRAKIQSYYEDDIFEDENVKYGTRVVIKIPENYIYNISK